MSIDEMIDSMTKGVESALPKVSHKLISDETEFVSMRDGVKLATRIILTDHSKDAPVLFTRVPYPDYVKIMVASWSAFVRRGYNLVIQECRGRGKSEGKWEPFVNEREDGIDAVNWLAKENWHNGKIALVGNSYSSYTQLVIADQLPDNVKTMVPNMYGFDRYAQMYQNGLFRPDTYTTWAVDNSPVPHNEKMKHPYFDAMAYRPVAKMDQHFFDQKLDFYQDYIHSENPDDPYWQQTPVWTALKAMPEKINIPICIVDGWFDHHLNNDIWGYDRLRPEIKAKSKVILGPWDHLNAEPGVLNYANADEYGAGAIREIFDWLEFQLKGNKLAGAVSGALVYELGAQRWRRFDTWRPTAQTETFYLGSKSQLFAQPDTSDEVASYQYDPQHARQTMGGNGVMGMLMNNPGHHGPQLQQKTAQSDSLIFISEPLKEAQTLVGKAMIELNVASSVPDTAFMVKLEEVFSDGRVINISDSGSTLRLRNQLQHAVDYQPGQFVTLEMPLWEVLWQIQAGSRIRLEVTSSNWPAYNIHNNTTTQWSEQQEGPIATQTVKFNGSKITLPILIETDK